ncbi:hypothetical protein E1295_35710 [Nonomuraea mesophila]|uniref:Uncharacterized protein n=1 Tax=Nonomuraea mesophila TaxID=2530382 RepID=A0A4V6PG56_9ACTN|nr:hypothetical protein E1295_35710 [Nonomuraea mesophila]
MTPPLWWLGAVWGVAAVCLIAAAVLLAGVGAGASGLAPTRTFASGESVTVPVDPADRPAVYIASDRAVNYACEISGGPGPARLAKTADAPEVTEGGTVWQQFLVINAPAKGDYRLTCVNRERAPVRYGVGRDAASAAGGTATPLLMGGAGLLAGVIGTAVVLAGRAASRKRLAVGG